MSEHDPYNDDDNRNSTRLHCLWRALLDYPERSHQLGEDYGPAYGHTTGDEHHLYLLTVDGRNGPEIRITLSLARLLELAGGTVEEYLEYVETEHAIQRVCVTS